MKLLRLNLSAGRILTLIMGNKFAVSSVITVGIGIIFVFAQGANVIIMLLFIQILLMYFL